MTTCTTFAEKHGSGAAHMAYQILNNIDVDENTYKTEYDSALRWRDFNAEEYFTHEREETEKLSALFLEAIEV